MIKADVRTMSVELEETVLDQLLEFSMIVQSLKESFPEEVKEELRPIFEISITEYSEEQVVEKVGKRLYEKNMQKAVMNLIASTMVEDDTELTIRNEQHKILAKGEWWKDRIYPYYLSKMKGFLWTDSNKIIIDIKE